MTADEIKKIGDAIEILTKEMFIDSVELFEEIKHFFQFDNTEDYSQVRKYLNFKNG